MTAIGWFESYFDITLDVARNPSKTDMGSNLPTTIVDLFPEIVLILWVNICVFAEIRRRSRLDFRDYLLQTTFIPDCLYYDLAVIK